MRRLKISVGLWVGFLLLFGGHAVGWARVASPSVDAGGSKLFITSAVEHSDLTATFPLHRGTSNGRTVWYIVLDSSNGEDAAALGVNHARKLNNAKGTRAVQSVTIVDGVVDFPATVDFTPERQVVPGPEGFPPIVAEPGAIGEVGYSPLILLPDGTVWNAPHVANDTGQADKVANLDTVGGFVTYRETSGFQGGKAVRYASTDASDPVAAALEDVTFASLLNEAPFVGDDSTDSARASLAAFVNGQTGVDNPERQGLNSTLLDGLDPLNVLRWNPSQGRYSPLWDVHLAEWSSEAAAAGEVVRLESFGKVFSLGRKGLIFGPGGAPFAASGFIVNCPIVSSD